MDKGAYKGKGKGKGKGKSSWTPMLTMRLTQMMVAW